MFELELCLDNTYEYLISVGYTKYVIRDITVIGYLNTVSQTRYESH